MHSLGSEPEIEVMAIVQMMPLVIDYYKKRLLAERHSLIVELPEEKLAKM